MRVVTGLLCDQIRTEDNGKLFVIGAYSTAMMVSQFPAPVSLAMLIQLDRFKAGESTVHMRLWQGDIRIGEIRATIEIPEEPSVWIPINMPPIRLDAPTDIWAEYLDGTDEWLTFLRVQVQLGVPTPTT